MMHVPIIEKAMKPNICTCVSQHNLGHIQIDTPKTYYLCPPTRLHNGSSFAIHVDSSYKKRAKIYIIRHPATMERFSESLSEKGQLTYIVPHA